MTVEISGGYLSARNIGLQYGIRLSVPLRHQVIYIPPESPTREMFTPAADGTVSLTGLQPDTGYGVSARKNDVVGVLSSERSHGITS